MEAIQGWFAPLLWIMGIITTFVAFYKLCRPFRDFLQFPKKITEQLQKLDEKVDGHFNETNERMDAFSGDLRDIKNEMESLKNHQEVNDTGTEALLRDRILQAHRYLMGKDSISQDEYESVTAMFQSYTALGGNHFVSRLMADINTKKIDTSSVPLDTMG